MDGNVHSTIPCGGGLLAFTEQGTAGGWRIRYCAEVCWDDGPGTSSDLGCFDLQGVATHEYGHALGLGHSNVPGATMFPSISGSGISTRSTHADDIAGIQAIYGLAGPSKPSIQSVNTNGSQLTLVGTGFDPVNNEVWFTHADPGGDGDPVLVVSAPSTGGGTQIVVDIPSDAGPGDVLVKLPHNGPDALSNAFPGETCPEPISYCVTSPNSAGSGALIASSGSTSVAANDLVLETSAGPASQNGIFYYGPGEALVPFGDGFRCVAGPFCRLSVVQMDGGGNVSFALDLTDPPNEACRITPGNTWYFQFWFRDPAFGGSGFNLSDGLRATFCP